jgi:hypothetical protein
MLTHGERNGSGGTLDSTNLPEQYVARSELASRFGGRRTGVDASRRHTAAESKMIADFRLALCAIPWRNPQNNYLGREADG